MSAPRRLPARVSCPSDVFVVLCVELQRLSDMLLLAAQNAVKAEVDEPSILMPLANANLHVSNLMEIAKALMEEPAQEQING